MSDFAKCPHCGTEVSNDGTMSGKLGKCPSCGGTFTMPPLKADDSDTSSPLIDTSRRASSPALPIRKPEQPANNLPWIAGGIGVLVVIGAVGAILNSTTPSKSNPPRNTTKQVPSPDDSAEREADVKKRLQEYGIGEKVTYANFSRIAVGMNRLEVCQILGFD